MACRYQAIYLLMDGYSKEDVIFITKISSWTLIRWIHAFNRSGIAGLKPEPKLERPSRLSAEQKRLLDQDLQRNPRELGYDFSTWDGKKIKHHIEQKFGVQFQIRRVQVLLHELDFSLQRPRPRPAKGDPVAQATFQTQLVEKKRPSSTQRTFSSTWTKPM